MDLPATVYIAIGAIAAAFITGAFSFVNLIIAKDQKTLCAIISETLPT
jgi:hypothetical protein